MVTSAISRQLTRALIPAVGLALCVACVAEDSMPENSVNYDNPLIDGEPMTDVKADGPEQIPVGCGVLGSWGYCSIGCPCSEGEGDCDSELDCLAGLECVEDVGEDYGWAWNVDVCEPEPPAPCSLPSITTLIPATYPAAYPYGRYKLTNTSPSLNYSWSITNASFVNQYTYEVYVAPSSPYKFTLFVTVSGNNCTTSMISKSYTPQSFPG